MTTFLRKMLFLHSIVPSQGVMNLHRMDVVHCNLKCGQFLLNQDSNVFVSDFGLPSRLQSSSPWEAPETLQYGKGIILW